MNQPRRDGRHATEPYRVRVGETWYHVDPTFPRDGIEPGDTVVLYPAGGDAVVAVLEGHDGLGKTAFANLDGGRFEVPSADIAAIHLAAVDTSG